VAPEKENAARIVDANDTDIVILEQEGTDWRSLLTMLHQCGAQVDPCIRKRVFASMEELICEDTSEISC
jgi:hypothetical protein